jgi:multidrug efflux pump subunit AcrB
MEDRAQLADLQNLYVYSQQGPQKVPLAHVSKIAYELETGKIRHRNQFRTITIGAFPVPGVLSSEVLEMARPKLATFEKRLPPGYNLIIGGEEEEQSKGFQEMAIVMVISIGLIFLALVFQFKSLVKPFIVFAAIPYGVVGSLAALWLMGTTFDFMAFLGIASLIGVIVSHIIVLFDFVEEMHAQGKPFQQAVLDAGIARLRPVFITVGATVLGLVPLALHGGPLWEPLCYTQIGGLLVANFITKLLVPSVYAICVLDLKIIKWDDSKASG